MIRVEHLTKAFRKIHAIRDISFEVETGEILGLLGPNGAGKTTTMRILAGFFPPTSGRVWLDGVNLYSDEQNLRLQIGYLPENVPLYPNLTTEEFLLFVAELKRLPSSVRKESIKTVIKQCDLALVRRRLVGKLSKGFKQRIGLAQALIGDPAFLILDEPTGGLDPKQIMEVRSLIKELAKEKTVIISTHILPEVSMLCSRVLIMDEGILVASGTPGELAEKLRRSSELIVTVRGTSPRLEEAFNQISGMIAIRHEHLGKSDHEYFIRYKKDKEVRPAISRCIVDSGLELLELREAPMSLEEIFLKIVVKEEGV